jgi:hypothetical protein
LAGGSSPVSGSGLDTRADADDCSSDPDLPRRLKDDLPLTPYDR